MTDNLLRIADFNTLWALNICSGNRISLVHPHIERCIHPIAEASLTRVKLITGNSEIEINSTDLFDGKAVKNISNLRIVRPDDGGPILKLMKSLNKDPDLQTTFIFSTHDSRIVDMCDHVVHLLDGEITNDEHKEGSDVYKI